MDSLSNKAIIVYSGDSYVGGLIGNIDNNSAQQSLHATNLTNEGKVVQGNNYCIGGIFGRTNGYVRIDHAVNRADVSANKYSDCGGIVGLFGETVGHDTMTYCVNYGNVSGSYYTGGIVGKTNARYSDTHRNANEFANAKYSLIDTCLNYGKVTSKYTYTGGIAGWISATEINRCHNLGDNPWDMVLWMLSRVNVSLQNC